MPTLKNFVMGATDIMVRGEGVSMSAAFHTLQEEAIHEYGHDTYNGTISTISEWTDKTRACDASGLPVENFLEGLLDELDKREAAGVCLREPVAGKPGIYVFAGWAAE